MNHSSPFFVVSTGQVWWPYFSSLYKPSTMSIVLKYKFSSTNQPFSYLSIINIWSRMYLKSIKNSMINSEIWLFKIFNVSVILFWTTIHLQWARFGCTTLNTTWLSMASGLSIKWWIFHILNCHTFSLNKIRIEDLNAQH